MRTARALTILLTFVLAASGCDREPTSPAAADRSILPSDGPRSDKGGNSANVERCRDYQNWNTRDGQPFTSFAECVSYGAKGSQLINDDALTCLNGGWQSLGDGTTPFTSEQECVDYAGGTGTPVVNSADVSISTDPGTLGCGLPHDPLYCVPIHIRVYNAGSVPVTVSWTLNATWVATSPLGTDIFPAFANGTCTDVYDNVNSTLSSSCTGATISPGGSTFVAHVIARNGSTQAGTVSITASSMPDPNPLNNTFTWNFTAPSPP
jgi:hypothetical protein